MTSMTSDVPVRKVIVGIDTHKHLHVAVAIDHHGARLGDLSVSADSGRPGSDASSRAIASSVVGQRNRRAPMTRLATRPSKERTAAIQNTSSER